MNADNEGSPKAAPPERDYWRGVRDKPDSWWADLHQMMFGEPTATENSPPPKPPPLSATKRRAEALDRQIKAAAKFARAAVDHGVSTFAEYVALAAETLGYDGTIAASDVLERTWNTLRKRQGFERFDEAGKTADVLKKPSKPAEPAPKALGSSATTATQNAKADERWEKAGLCERPPVEAETRDQWDAEAVQLMADGPLYAGRLVEELAGKPRTIDSVEEMVLNRHLRDIESRRRAGECVADELQTTIEASERAGTVRDGAGVSRQAERAADFSLKDIVRQHLQSVNERPSDEQLAKYGEMADQIKKLEGELEEMQKKLIEAEIDKRIAEAKAASKKPKPDKPKKGTEREATEAVAAFKDAWAKVVKAAKDAASRPTSGGLDAQSINALAEAAKAAAGVGTEGISSAEAPPRVSLTPQERLLKRLNKLPPQKQAELLGLALESLRQKRLNTTSKPEAND